MFPKNDLASKFMWKTVQWGSRHSQFKINLKDELKNHN